jgi:PAS domain S-box-containing protein
MGFLRQIFGRPAGEELDRRLITTVLLAALAVTGLLFVAGIDPEVMLFMSALLLAALALGRWGAWRWAAAIAPLCGLAGISFLLFHNLGLRDTAIIGLPAVILAGGLLNGKRGTLLLGGLCLMVLAALGLAEMTGLLKTPFSAFDHPADYLAVGAALALTTVIQWTVIDRLNQHTAAVRHELAERRQVEQALRESETRYRLISEVSSDYMFSSRLNDQDELALNWVAGAFEAITGYGYEEYVAEGGWRAHLHPDDEIQDQRDMAGLAENKPVITEVRTRRKDGVYRWVRVYANPVWDAGRRRLVGIYGGVQDVSARRAADDTLRRRVAELDGLNRVSQILVAQPELGPLLRQVGEEIQALFQAPVLYIALLDPTTQLLHFYFHYQNNRHEETPPLASGLGMTSWVMEHRQPVLINSDWARTAAGYNVYYPDGQAAAASLSVPLQVGERAIGVISLQDMVHENVFDDDDVRQLTTVAATLAVGIDNARLHTALERELEERRQAEEAVRHLNAELENRVRERTLELQAANQELESFAYSVSHDLRAPLRSVDGFAHLLLDEFADGWADPARRYLIRVMESSQRMGQLIDDLLSFSRLSRKMLNRSRVSPAGLVTEVLDELRAEMAGREVEVRVGDLPDCDADPALLRQVFVNLIGNAVKYTGRRAQARIEIGWADGAYFVRDNGAGFDMAYEDKLFGVFQRLHSDSEFEGTGIGLAIVERIVARHGGRAWAEGELDKGATFYFSLAAAPAAEH